MATTKDSATAHPSTRISRGIALHRERGVEIERTPGGTYRVPSCSGETSYVVYLGEFTFCSCPDHRRAKEAGEACKHRVAAEIFVAKRCAARRRRASRAS
jgi:predicted nucleic acid-binding Zn finger protein